MCTNFKDIKTFYIGIFLDTEASEARSSYTAVNTAHHDQFLPSYTSHIILPSIVLVSDSFTKYVNIAHTAFEDPNRNKCLHCHRQN